MSRTGTKSWITGLYYGMDIYPLLEEYIMQLKADVKKMDVRIMTLLLYHYRFMQKQIEYITSLLFCENGREIVLSDFAEISRGYRNLEDIANADIHLIIKYNIKLDPNILGKVAESIPICCETENKLLERYYDYLNKLSIEDCKDNNTMEQNHSYM